MSWDIEGALAKYQRKLMHVRQRRVLSEVIPKASEKLSLTLTNNLMVRAKVKPLLDMLTIPAEIRLCYYAYSLALDKSQREMEFMVDRIREHQILRQKWEKRGLNPDVLDKIDELLIWHK
jgi:hypothetical protein